MCVSLAVRGTANKPKKNESMKNGLFHGGFSQKAGTKNRGKTHDTAPMCAANVCWADGGNCTALFGRRATTKHITAPKWAEMRCTLLKVGQKENVSAEFSGGKRVRKHKKTTRNGTDVRCYVCWAGGGIVHAFQVCFSGPGWDKNNRKRHKNGQNKAHEGVKMT